MVEGGVPRPRELVQAERLTFWVQKLCPEASEPLRLAARCQHLGRYRFPRSNFPEGRIGYLKWRSELSRLHADTAAEILREVGYDEETIAHVRRIVRKQGLTADTDVQLMEDALCLAFLQHEYAGFCDKHSDDKLLVILTRTWRKMSPAARQIALSLSLSGRALALVKQAIEHSSK